MIIFNPTKFSGIIFNFMGTILSRIQEIASAEGITIGALERQIGASKGVLSRAINNGTDIQSKWVQTIVENYPHYSPRWLMTGRGEMLSDESVAPVKQQPVISDERLVTQGVTPELITELLNRITEQAAEIGRLQEQIRQMRHRLEKDASDAPISGTANVG